MGYRLPNGSTFEIASTLGAAKNITALTNANPAVATSASHGLQSGDIVVLSSGWTRLNGKAVRVTVVDTSTFRLDGVDTTDTSAFPSGSGTGQFRSASGWQQISQITEFSTSGGEQQFATFGFLEEDEDRQLPTNKSPVSLSLTVADDPSLAYVATVEAADQDKQARVSRLNMPGGAKILYNAYTSITSTPAMSRNNVMTRTISMSLAARPTRYAA